MRVLIFGNANSSFVGQFSSALRKHDDSTQLKLVHIVNQPPSICPLTYTRVRRAVPSLPKHIGKIPKLSGLAQKLAQAFTNRQIQRDIEWSDVLLLHGFNRRAVRILSELDLKAKPLVGAFWGSDFYERKEERLLQECIERCRFVTASTEQMSNDISSAFGISAEKMRRCTFGLAPLDQLFKLRDSPSTESKIKLGLPTNKSLIVACGYSASPRNRHLDILASISEAQRSSGREIHLLFPMTYGGPKYYVSEVRREAENSGIPFTVFDKFLPDELTGHLRKASDIFVHVRPTDANSGSLQEHIVSGSVIVTGAWLPYQHHQDNGLDLHTIDNLAQLPNKLAEIFADFETFQAQAKEKNKLEKFRNSLWSECIEIWHSVLLESLR